MHVADSEKIKILYTYCKDTYSFKKTASLKATFLIPTSYFLLVSAVLFCIGVAIILTKRNAIVVLMGIELILNAANLNLVAFNRHIPQRLDGHVFALFIIIVAAAEAAVALAIVLKTYHHFQTINLDEIKMEGKKDSSLL